MSAPVNFPRTLFVGDLYFLFCYLLFGKLMYANDIDQNIKLTALFLANILIKLPLILIGKNNLK
jgi:hypothetical protein